MLLTIGMIVKNEEKYLQKCLESITSVIKQIDCELIIADTGSTDNTISIAEKFTNKIYNFTWCSDFSAARNFTLQKSNGDWFMFIDADEILENPNILVEFFNSGEYKKYNSATFIQRNYKNETEDIFSDFIVCRLTKISKNTKFINAIHERFESFDTPTKNLPLITNHYGYVISDKELILKKANRNIELLKGELKSNPASPVTLLQLCESYKAAGNYEMAEEYCFKGIKYSREQNNEIILRCLYAIAASIYKSANKNTEALSIINEYFNSKNSISATDIEMFALQGIIYFNIRNYNKSAESFNNYDKLYEEFQKGFHHTPEMLCHSIRFISPSSYRKTLYIATKALSNLSKFSEAERMLDKIPFSSYTGKEQDYELRLETEFSIMEKQKDYSRIIKLYGQSDKNALISLQNYIDTCCINDNIVYMVSGEFYKSNLPSEPYADLMRIRYEDMTSAYGTDTKVKKLLCEIIKLKNLNNSDLIYFALKYKISLYELSEAADAFDLDELTKKIISEHSDYPNIILNYCQLQNPRNLKEQLWLCLLYGSILPFISDCSKEKRILIYKMYSELMNNYLTSVYNPETLNDNNAFLFPKCLRFGYYSCRALIAMDNNNLTSYIKYLRLALDAIPETYSFIKKLQSDLDEELNQKKEAEHQFNVYSQKLKKTILELINQGNLDMARQILSSYEEINPMDKDIILLKSNF